MFEVLLSVFEIGELDGVARPEKVEPLVLGVSDWVVGGSVSVDDVVFIHDCGVLGVAAEVGLGEALAGVVASFHLN